MKKIFLSSLIIVFIPFFIVMVFDIEKKEEISLNYVSNKIIRVKRMENNDIEYLPLEEYIVGVLAGEMPIYFKDEALKASFIIFKNILGIKS